MLTELSEKRRLFELATWLVELRIICRFAMRGDFRKEPSVLFLESRLKKPSLFDLTFGFRIIKSLLILMGNYLYAIIPYEAEIHVDPIDAEDGYCFERFPDIPQLIGYMPSFLDFGYGTFTLFPGFLLINTCFRMYILEDTECEVNPLRKDIYEIAKALGATEAWYYSEYSIDDIYEDKSISYNNGSLIL